MLATTGLRRGEAVGLSCSSVNPDPGTLAVRQARSSIRYRTEAGEPKTRHGGRVVGQDPVTIEVLAAVREQQRGTVQSRVVERVEAGRDGKVEGVR